MTMPVPATPEYPDIERLRAALVSYDHSRGIFPSVTTAVIEAARSLIETFDNQVAQLDAMREEAAARAVLQAAGSWVDPTNGVHQMPYRECCTSRISEDHEAGCPWIASVGGVDPIMRAPLSPYTLDAVNMQVKKHR